MGSNLTRPTRLGGNETALPGELEPVPIAPITVPRDA